MTDVMREVRSSEAKIHLARLLDAAYLELAKRHPAGLATLDTALAKAARNEGVMLVGRPH